MAGCKVFGGIRIKTRLLKSQKTTLPAANLELIVLRVSLGGCVALSSPLRRPPFGYRRSNPLARGMRHQNDGDTPVSLCSL